MKRLRLFICIIGLAGGFSLQVKGADIEVGVTDMATIFSSDTIRFLLRFDLPSRLEGSTIDYAQLLFIAQADSGSEEPLDIAGFRVITGWDLGSVIWAYPWSNPGGDYNDSSLTVSTISGQKSENVSLDITGILSAWVKGKPNYGLILKSLVEKGRNFTLIQDPEFPPGVKAKVYYTAKEVSK